MFDDVDDTAQAECTYYMIDSSDDVDAKADHYDESMLREGFAPIRSTTA